MIVAPARSAVAEVTCPCATVIEAESAASCVLDAPAAWSAASFACAVASVALAAATSLDSVAESIAASRWPLPTFSCRDPDRRHLACCREAEVLRVGRLDRPGGRDALPQGPGRDGRGPVRDRRRGRVRRAQEDRPAGDAEHHDHGDRRREERLATPAGHHERHVHPCPHPSAVPPPWRHRSELAAEAVQMLCPR
jgi:hypothetical protein